MNHYCILDGDGCVMGSIFADRIEDHDGTFWFYLDKISIGTAWYGYRPSGEPHNKTFTKMALAAKNTRKLLEVPA